MVESLTELPDRARHRMWAELDGDSALTSVRFPALGWIPWKRERVRNRVSWFALSVLVRGSGTFRGAGEAEARPVKAPGFFMQAPGMAHDYGPVGGGLWEEIYWTLHGERVREWQRGGWWHCEPRFVPVTAEEAADFRRWFDTSCRALETRNGPALDAVKLAIERWLAGRAERTRDREDPLARIVARWRREPQKAWSLEAAAKEAGLSYTQFRAKFLAKFGTSPYDYVLRSRIELAERWLMSTDEPVKVIAVRCGFGGAEAFVRAFGKIQGVSPGKWREQGGL